MLNRRFVILTILSTQFSSIKYIHSIVPPPSMHRTLTLQNWISVAIKH